jgi:hypothetical protein
VWELLTADLSRRAVEAAERYADGEATEYDRRTARHGAQFVRGGVTRDVLSAARAAYEATHGDCYVAAQYASVYALVDRTSDQDAFAQANLLRDIFGNPFRPVTLNPSWRTSAVVALATSIYEERAFDRMPILADALEDAGCDNADILAHCRDPHLLESRGALPPRTPHVRGCWVVDLVLGKS